MQISTPRRTGRPPKRADHGGSTMVTVRVDCATKNLLIDMADGYDLSLADYITLLVRRDAES